MENKPAASKNGRAGGVLLHVTSLPSPHGVGDLGPGAYSFVDFLAAANQRIWQILPLNPTGTYLGNSPYTSYSAFAGNPLLISLDLLAKEELLSKAEAAAHPRFHREKADYKRAIEYKGPLLRLTYERFRDRAQNDSAFLRFCADNSHWLEDYSLFAALKERVAESAWYEWPDEFRDRQEQTLSHVKVEQADRIQMSKFFQYLFFRQWSALKTYANQKGIRIIGDIPIYTSTDSADVWASPEMYKLTKDKKPEFVAGAPPDYFSATGQRWGNPVYRWEYVQQTEYAWWIQRLKHNLNLFDRIRLDHFRGFVAYWEIPAAEETAVNGKWTEVPAMDFFNTVVRHFPELPIIVEDLGFITPDVKKVMSYFGFPGMKILLFAFGPDLPTNPYAPHNYSQNCVVYTGTHDNNTVRGWFEREAGPEDRKRFLDYIGREMNIEDIHWEWIRLAMASVADLAIVPAQDLLGVGEESRMNLPSRSKGNWAWRFFPGQLTDQIGERLAQMTRIYHRVEAVETD